MSQFHCLPLSPLYFSWLFSDRTKVINIFNSFDRIQMRKMPEGQVQMLKIAIYSLARDDRDTDAQIISPTWYFSGSVTPNSSTFSCCFHSISSHAWTQTKPCQTVFSRRLIVLGFFHGSCMWFWMYLWIFSSQVLSPNPILIIEHNPVRHCSSEFKRDNVCLQKFIQLQTQQKKKSPPNWVERNSFSVIY